MIAFLLEIVYLNYLKKGVTIIYLIRAIAMTISSIALAIKLSITSTTSVGGGSDNLIKLPNNQKLKMH